MRASEMLQAYNFHYAASKKSKPNDNNPNSLDDLGHGKQGIWKQTNTLKNKVLGKDPSLLARKENTPTGLVNLGATCYVNSLLQCMFMNTSFRKFMYDLKESDLSKKGLKHMKHIQEIFAHLQASKRVSWNPRALIMGLELKPHEQQDAQEFNKLLLNIMEATTRESKNPSVKQFIPRMFQGKIANTTQCRHCKNESKRLSTFYELSCQVKGMKTLEDSLESMIAKEALTGCNQYLCSRCQTKRDADRRAVLVSLPPVLNVQLIRFCYDRQEFRKRKVLDNIGVPRTLDMSPYVEEEEEKWEQQEERTGTKTRSSRQRQQQQQRQQPILYDLAAILLHHGTSANVGHYVIDAKDETTGEWWHFDDEKVTSIGRDVCKPATRKKSAGGGSAAAGGSAKQSAEAAGGGGGGGEDYGSINGKGREGVSSSSNRRRDDDDDDDDDEDYIPDISEQSRSGTRKRGRSRKKAAAASVPTGGGVDIPTSSSSHSNNRREVGKKSSKKRCRKRKKPTTEEEEEEEEEEKEQEKDGDGNGDVAESPSSPPLTHRTSKNAYMMVYTRRREGGGTRRNNNNNNNNNNKKKNALGSADQEGGLATTPSLPKALLECVEAANREFDQKCGDYTERARILEDSIEERKNIVDRVIAENAKAFNSESKGSAAASSANSYVVLNRHWLKDYFTGIKAVLGTGARAGKDETPESSVVAGRDYGKSSASLSLSSSASSPAIPSLTSSKNAVDSSGNSRKKKSQQEEEEKEKKQHTAVSSEDRYSSAINLKPGDGVQESCQALLCTHGKLCPHKKATMKRLSYDAWTIISKDLQAKAWLRDPHYIPLSELCTTCVTRFRDAASRKEKENSDNSRLLALLKTIPPTHESSRSSSSSGGSSSTRGSKVNGSSARYGGSNSSSVKEQQRNGGMWISRVWVKLFKEYVAAKRRKGAAVVDKNGFTIEVPEDLTADLQCAHGRLMVGKKDRRLITGRAWKALRERFRGVPYEEGAPECPLCLDEKLHSKKITQERRKKRRKEQKELGGLTKLMRNGGQGFPGIIPPRSGSYFIIPHSWATMWVDYIQNSSEKPPPLNTSELLCEHKMLKYNPVPKSLDPGGADSGKLAIVNLDEMDILREKFGFEGGPNEHPPQVTFTSSDNRWAGTAVDTVPEICQQCTKERADLEKQARLFYSDGEIHIVVLDRETPVPIQNDGCHASIVGSSSDGGGAASSGGGGRGTIASTFTRRKRPKRRAKSKGLVSYTVTAESSDKLSVLRLKIMEYTDASPAQQKLFYNRKELTEEHKSLSELEIENGTTLYMKIDPNGSYEVTFAGLQDDTFHGQQESGFDGSVLANWGAAVT